MSKVLGHPLFYLAFWAFWSIIAYFVVARPYLQNQRAILLALEKLCDIMSKR